MNDYIRKLSQVDNTDVVLAGGKGASLGEMIQAGVPVPQGWVITTELFKAFMAATELRDVVAKFTKDLDPDDTERVYFVGTRLTQIIASTPWPRHLVTWLTSSSMKEDLDAEAPMAVRSSAPEEDSDAVSFAGQHATFLNVQGEKNVLRRVKDCFASLYEPRAMSYRLRQGLSLVDTEIAVVVQRLVDPQFSGVMFTRDPNTGENKTTIEVVEGLGEALVSGQVTPDRYEVVSDGDGGCITSHVGNSTQTKALRPRRWGYGGTEWRDRRTTGIDDLAVEFIYAYGQMLEDHYGGPQDVEFVVNEGGEISIVQSRPITTSGRQLVGVLDLPVRAKGSPACFGVGSGPIKVVRNLSDLTLVNKGDVLVTEMTTPDYVPVFPKLAGLITGMGGSTCHAAIISREYGLPCVVGVGPIEGFTDGEMVTVDGGHGFVHQG